VRFNSVDGAVQIPQLVFQIAKRVSEVHAVQYAPKTYLRMPTFDIRKILS
jgi:hypothetical protein